MTITLESSEALRDEKTAKDHLAELRAEEAGIIAYARGDDYATHSVRTLATVRNDIALAEYALEAATQRADQDRAALPTVEDARQLIDDLKAADEAHRPAVEDAARTLKAAHAAYVAAIRAHTHAIDAASAAILASGIPEKGVTLDGATLTFSERTQELMIDFKPIVRHYLVDPLRYDLQLEAIFNTK